MRVILIRPMSVTLSEGSGSSRWYIDVHGKMGTAFDEAFGDFVWGILWLFCLICASVMYVPQKKNMTVDGNLSV